MTARPLSTSLLLVVLLSIPTGCGVRPKTVTDTPSGHSTYLNRYSFYQDGDTVIIHFEPQPQDLQPARFQTEVYDGELYLSANRVKKQAQPRRVAIDLAKLDLREPWQEHVYWKTLGWYDNRIQRLLYWGPLHQHVGRAKVTLQPLPQPDPEPATEPAQEESATQPTGDDTATQPAEQEAATEPAGDEATTQPATEPAPQPEPEPTTPPTGEEPAEQPAADPAP